jgi:hypothetical protein
MVAEVERGLQRLGRVEERGVDAVERLAAAVVRALNRQAALGKRRAAHLHPAEAVAGALLFLEERHVDLAAEHLVDAAHEAVPGLLVVEDVERRAVAGDAARGMDEPVAEAAALTAFMLLRRNGGGRHGASVGQASQRQPNVNA